jgi:hypothetical protein
MSATWNRNTQFIRNNDNVLHTTRADFKHSRDIFLLHVAYTALLSAVLRGVTPESEINR